MINDVKLFVGVDKVKEKGDIHFYVYQYLFNSEKYDDIINYGEVKLTCPIIETNNESETYITILPAHNCVFCELEENSLYTFTSDSSLYYLLKYLVDSKDTYVSYYEYYDEKIVIDLKQYSTNSDLFYYLLNSPDFNHLIDTKYGFIRFNEKNYTIQINLYVDEDINNFKVTSNIFECINDILEHYNEIKVKKEFPKGKEIGYMCENCYIKQKTRIKYRYDEDINGIIGTEFIYNVVSKNMKCEKCGSDELAEIDYNLLDAICLFNMKGYNTRFCCESHGEDGDLYIAFDDTYETKVLFGYLKMCKSAYKYYCAEEQYGNYSLRYNTVVSYDDRCIINKFEAIEEIEEIAKSIPDVEHLNAYYDLILSVLPKDDHNIEILKPLDKEDIDLYLSKICDIK